MKQLKLIILILVFKILLINHTYSQEASIKILDANTKNPIENVYYLYDKSTGYSDKEGKITFIVKKGEALKFSHINYGSWIVSEEELKKAITSGVLEKQAISIMLHPVAIISLRTTSKKNDAIFFNTHDKLLHDGGAILNQNPVFNSIRKSGAYGFDPVMRGFKYEQLNIVLDGAQGATAACPNRMDTPTSQMSPNMLERVEILKGPYALRFGTGLGGTINFISSPLLFSDVQNIYGRISAGYETNGNVYRSEGMLGISKKRINLNLFGAWSQGDDYLSGNKTLIQSDFYRTSFGAALGVKISENQQVKLSANKNYAKDVDFAGLPMDLRNDETWMFNAQHEIILKTGSLKHLKTNLYASFVDHLMDNLLRNNEPRMINASTLASTYNLGGRTEGTWQVKNGKLYVGADYRSEGAKGTRTREFILGMNAGKIMLDNAWQNGNINKTGIFAERQFSIANYRAIISSRLELNNAQINDPSNEFLAANTLTSINQINPNISFGVTKNLNQEILVGAYASRVQRSGSLTERFINYFPVGVDPYEMLGNPELTAEKNNQIDVTFNWKKEKSIIDIDVFGAYIQDYISSFIDPSLKTRIPTSPGVRRYVNISEAMKYGTEITWTQSIFKNINQTIALAYTYAQDLERNEPLPEIAPLDIRYSISGMFLNEKIYPQLILRHVLSQNRISKEFGESISPSFTLLDVKLAYHINSKFKTSIGVNNLLDANYYEHLNRSVVNTLGTPIYGVGRNIFATLSMSL
jgi:iron complex outermembrane receptor protein